MKIDNLISSIKNYNYNHTKINFCASGDYVQNPHSQLHYNTLKEDLFDKELLEDDFANKEDKMNYFSINCPEYNIPQEYCDIGYIYDLPAYQEQYNKLKEILVLPIINTTPGIETNEPQNVILASQDKNNSNFITQKLYLATSNINKINKIGDEEIARNFENTLLKASTKQNQTGIKQIIHIPEAYKFINDKNFLDRLNEEIGKKEVYFIIDTKYPNDIKTKFNSENFEIIDLPPLDKDNIAKILKYYLEITKHKTVGNFVDKTYLSPNQINMDIDKIAYNLSDYKNKSKFNLSKLNQLMDLTTEQFVKDPTIPFETYLEKNIIYFKQYGEI